MGNGAEAPRAENSSITLDTLRRMSFAAEIRARTGLTQAEFARRAGTSRTRLSAYENGRTSPELHTVERMAAAARAELALAPSGTRRVHHQMHAVADAVHHADTSTAVRLIAELIAWVRDGVVDLHALDQEPPTTGSRRWDALVAGVAELLATEAGQPVPGWTSSPGRILDHPWFVSSLRSLWPEILRSTPAAMSARGVLISAASLSSV